MSGSRKGKKSWRKNVDITDVEQKLDSMRTEERLGGVLHAKANDQLFSIDKKGDTKVRESLKHRKLRIDEILTPSSSITPPTRPNRISTIVKVATLPNGKVKVASKNNVQKIEQMAKRKAAQMESKESGAGPKASKKKKTVQGHVDLWGEGPSEEPAEETEKLEFAVEITTVKPVKKPKLPDQKAKHVEAVKITDAGASYRPTFEDHQAILQKALDLEEEKIARTEKLQAQMAYPPELDNLDDETFFQSDSEDEEAEEQNTESIDDDGSKKLKEPKRKTRAQRNKERARAAKEAEEARRKEQEQVLKQIDVLPKIETFVEQHISIIEDNTTKRSQLREAEALKGPKQVGPHKFKEAPIEIKLTEELTETLRELKPEGNLFKDRFLSLQERSLIEPRVPVGKRQRYKKTITERHDYKRFM
ncbi:hypothetical protein HDV05_007104 [Chytridiales sp. JEL 0842]|nr:hypothetical protein HDV05_007104 [Chytridiales sp. JEL 0842]